MKKSILFLTTLFSGAVMASNSNMTQNLAALGMTNPEVQA